MDSWRDRDLCVQFAEGGLAQLRQRGSMVLIFGHQALASQEVLLRGVVLHGGELAQGYMSVVVQRGRAVVEWARPVEGGRWHK